jgi:DNA-directed RNA polymerase beta subunit
MGTEIPNFTGVDFLPEEVPLSMSGHLLQAHIASKQEAPFRIVSQKYLIDSYNSWAPRMVNGVLEPGRSGKIFEHLKIHLDQNSYVKIKPYRVIEPAHSPDRCRLEHRDYEAIYEGQLVLVEKGDEKSIDTRGVIEIFRFPVMVGSHVSSKLNGSTTPKDLINMNECTSDGFGYYVIAGNEKAMTIHEKTRNDRINLYSIVVKSKKTTKFISEMISKSLHVTRKIAVTHFTGGKDDGKIRRLKALVRLFGESTIKQLRDREYKGLHGFRNVSKPAELEGGNYLPPKCEVPCLQLMLNCFDYDGVMLLPFLIYYFPEQFISPEKLKLMGKYGDRENYTDPNNHNFNQFFIEASSAFFDKLMPFLDPSIYQEVYQLLLADLAPISANFMRKEYSDESGMSFLDKMEDYIYWRIRPENIDIKYVESGEKTKATGILRRVTSNGIVDRSRLKEIIEVNFFQDSRVSGELDDAEKDNRMRQMFNTLMVITAKLLGKICGKTALDNQNDLGVRKFDGPGKIFEDIIGQSLELVLGGIQLQIKNSAASKENKIQTIINHLDNPSSGLRSITSSLHSKFTKSVSPTPKEVLSTEIMKRENMLTPISEVTKKNIPIRRVTKGDKGFAIRILKASELGFTDPCETPERNATGLVKRNALTSETSLDRDLEKEELEKYLTKEMNLRSLPAPRNSPDFRGIVALNGRILGWGDAEDIYRKLILARRIRTTPINCPSELKTFYEERKSQRGVGKELIIPHDTAIHLDRENLFLSISMEASRPIRPLLTVENGVLVLENVFRSAGIGDRWMSRWPEFVQLFANQNIGPWITGQIDSAFKWEKARVQYEATRSAINFLYHVGAIEYVDAQEQPSIFLAERLEDVVYKSDYLGQLKNILKSLEKDTAPVAAVAASAVTPDPKEIMKEARKKEISDEIDALLRNNYTHAEINPVVMFGAVGCTIPRANHTEGPRNSLESSMAKQAIGTFHTNPNRMDAAMRSLAYPNRPLAEVETAGIIGIDAFPLGQMSDLCVASTLGQTQEDSHIVNQKFIDYGGACSIIETTKKKIVVHDSHNVSLIIHPYNNRKTYRRVTRRRSAWFYRNLTEDGIARKGSYLKEGDCVIGCISKIATGNMRDSVWEDSSIFVSPGEEGFVDNIYYKEIEGFNKKETVIRVRFRALVPTEVGDKFAPRYAQKNTIGTILHPFELPCTQDGMTPSFIINPHAIPARKTVGLPLEMLAGRLATLTKERFNMTTFKHYDEENFDKNFLDYRLSKWDGRDYIDPGVYEVQKMDDKIRAIEEKYEEIEKTDCCKRAMFDGTNCEMFPDLIMMGGIQNRALKHKVRNKFQARGRGALNDVTFEPRAGRGNYGAVRFGEMELAAIKTLGLDEVIYDRMSYASGEVYYVACSRCGEQAGRSTDQSQHYFCRACDVQGVPQPTAQEVLEAQEKYYLSLGPGKEPGPIPRFIMVRTRRAWCALRAYLAGMGIKVDTTFEPSKRDLPKRISVPEK